MKNETSNSSSTSLLDIQNITHNFDYPLFKDINLSLQHKESIAIIGVSGSGKSTLLNIMCSLLKPNIGDVYFQNKNIYNLSQKEILKLRREEFGIIFQSHYLFRGFTASDNLQVSSYLSNNNIDMRLLKQLNIDHIITQGIGELSGGQQQRLSIARILNKKPSIIFADEPTGNLDKKTALDVIDVLFRYIFKNNGGMILVTHEEEIAFRCDKVYKLENEELIRLK